MATYAFQRVLVWSSGAGDVVRLLRNGKVEVHNAATGALLSTPTSDASGMVAFTTTDVPTVYLVTTGWTSEHITAASAVEAAAGFTVSEDTAVAALISNTGSSTRGALNSAVAAAPAVVALDADKLDKGGVNVTIGDTAMANMTDSNYSIAIGYGAMEYGTKSRENIALGNQALRNVTAYTSAYDQAHLDGTRNVSIGGGSLYFLTSGYSNVAVGRNAGACQVSGNGLVAIGSSAMVGAAPTGLSGQIENWAPFGASPADVVSTVAIGRTALAQASALNVVAVGGGALANNKKSDFNTAVGVNALNALDAGTGTKGGTYTVKGINGTYDQIGTTITLTVTGHGLVVGDLAYLQLTSGAAQTLQNDVARAYVASVIDANRVTVASPRTFTTSGNAVLVGAESAAAAPTNGNNTALGKSAGSSATAGANSTLVGMNAAFTSTSITDSVAVGQGALYAATSANQCAVVGQFAARFMAAGATQVTALGASALLYDVSGAPLTSAWANITGIGYDARVSGANQLQLGNTTQTVYTQAAVQTRSDARDKADVEGGLGLEFIEALRPVQYRWDLRDDYQDVDPDTGEVTHAEKDGSRKRSRFHQGLIAQDVAEVCERLGVDFGGLQDHTVNGGNDVMTLGYEELIAPLIKAVQELSARVTELEAR